MVFSVRLRGFDSEKSPALHWIKQSVTRPIYSTINNKNRGGLWHLTKAASRKIFVIFAIFDFKKVIFFHTENYTAKQPKGYRYTETP
jgi:hypothetical protein